MNTLYTKSFHLKQRHQKYSSGNSTQKNCSQGYCLQTALKSLSFYLAAENSSSTLRFVLTPKSAVVKSSQQTRRKFSTITNSLIYRSQREKKKMYKQVVEGGGRIEEEEERLNTPIYNPDRRRRNTKVSQYFEEFATTESVNIRGGNL